LKTHHSVALFGMAIFALVRVTGVGAEPEADNARTAAPPLSGGMEETKYIPVWKKWQRDIGDFNAELRDLSAKAKVPDEESLKKRMENESEGLEVITDGYGGVVDFNAAKGTVQYEATRKFAGGGGMLIDWEFELARDTQIRWNKSTELIPKIPRTTEGGGQEGEQPVFSIHIAKTNGGPFKAGDRVRLKGVIDDFSRFRKDYFRATGLVAIHYLENAPNPVFCLRMGEAELTLIHGADHDGGGKTGPAEAETPTGKTADAIKEQPRSDKGLQEPQGRWKGVSAARQAKAVSDAKQIVVACHAYALDHDGEFPPSLGTLLPEYLGPNSEALLYTNPEEKLGVRWDYQTGLKLTDPADKILLKSTDLHEGTPIVARVDGSVVPVQEAAAGHPRAAKAWTQAHDRWPEDREWKVPANQSLEVFLHEYKAAELKGHRASPNLSDWDDEGATFGNGLGNQGYAVQLHYQGTKSGKDYYDLEITYPEGGRDRTMNRRLIYQGAGVEVYRDEKYRICIQPRSFGMQDDSPQGRDDQANMTLPVERRGNLPDLAKAFPGEKLFSQTKLMGTESYGFATDLPFEELKKRLAAFLGGGWQETEMDPAVLKEAARRNDALLGNANFTNPAFPGVQVGLTQIKQEMEGRKSAAVIAVAGNREDEDR
jgi:hypothetical protein